MEALPNALPGPNIPSFVFVVLLAIVTGVGGALLAYAVPKETKMAASLLAVATPSALLALGVWDLRIRTAKARKRALASGRSAFEQSWVKADSIVFEQEQWELKTESEEVKEPWSNLRSAVEFKNVIMLEAQDRCALISKRAITDEKMAAFRRSALGPIDSGWSFRVGFGDYVLTEIPSQWRTYSLPVSFGVVIATLVIAVSTALQGLMLAYISQLPQELMFLASLAVIFQVGCFLIKYLTTHKTLGETWQTSFSESGVSSCTSVASSFMAWSTLTKFREASRCFLLYANAVDYYLLPKRCLSLDQLANLRGLLQRKLAKKPESTTAMA